MKRINIGHDFSIYPAGRYRDDGDFSGERFRREILIPSLIENGLIEIELDDTRGYDSSFLEEAFGGIFRDMQLDLKTVMEKIRLVTDDDFLRDEILTYMSEASKNGKR